MSSSSLPAGNGAATTSSGSGIVGYIRPPPGVREVVDKTAAFVARGGPEFEAKIRASDTSGKFNFLAADHPYHAYYKHKVAELQSGSSAPTAASVSAKADSAADASATNSAPNASVVSTSGAPSTEESGTAATADDKSASGAGASSSTAKASTSSALEAPPPPNPLSRALKALGDPAALSAPVDAFSPPHPTYLSARDIETIKLTAQFTAAQGKAFLSALAAKEAGNSAFEFLRPSHAAFLYFTSLVDQFHRILHPPAHTLEALRRAAGPGGGAAVLTRCVHRLEHRRREEEKKRSEAAAASARASSAAAAIDWHDFAVVETITFGDDEGLEGLSLEDSAPSSSTSSSSSSSSSAASGRAGGSGAAAAAGSSAGSGAGATETIRIRHDYTPGAALGLGGAGGSAAAASAAGGGAGASGGAGAGAGAGAALTGYVDPRTGLQIPLEAATEHLRVELLDPKWRAEKALHLSRQAGSLYAAGDELASNLKALASRRSDVFAAERSAGALGAPAGQAQGPIQPQGAPAAKRQRLDGEGGEAR